MSVVMSDHMRDINRRCQGETNRSTSRSGAVIFPLMTHGLLSRIELRLKALGISARRASLDSGMSPDAIRDLQRKPDNSPTLETIRKLAIGLQTTQEWLAYDIDDRSPAEPAEGGGLRVVGEVAAGNWLEVDRSAESDSEHQQLYDPVPVALDARYAAEAQFGLIVRGTCINNVATEGDVLACVDLYAVKRDLRNDDLVIVERSRLAGHLVERTAKFWTELDDRYELWPDSTDSRWQKPIVVAKTVGLNQEGDDGITVTVRALVTWIHRPAEGNWRRSKKPA